MNKLKRVTSQRIRYKLNGEAKQIILTPEEFNWAEQLSGIKGFTIEKLFEALMGECRHRKKYTLTDIQFSQTITILEEPTPKD